MFKNYVQTAYRSLQKNRAYSFLNIFGLAIGIACAGLIFLWVEDETRFDSNNANRNSVYLVKVNAQEDKGMFTHSSTPGPMAGVLSRFRGVEATCRTSEGVAPPMFRIGDRTLNAGGLYAEPTIFDLFTLPFVQGNPRSALTQLYSLVITERTAKKFFGNEQNVIGKTVRMDDKQDYVITGVIKDIPENATVQFEWLAPFELFLQQHDQYKTWNNFGLTTYVKLSPGIDPSTINKQLLDPRYDFTTQRVEKELSTEHVFLFGMKDWRLYDQFENGKPTGGGRIQYVHLFSVIAWIILFIACINFMNLATARSEKRSKEVGVRKVLGAGKNSLIGQFLGEALFMTLLAAIVAVLLMSLSLPAFNLLVRKNLSLGVDSTLHWSALILLTLLCGLISGSYPSLYLSAFNPIYVLKGTKLKTGGAAFVRKGLVVLQFTISIVLIISTIIVYQQIGHIKQRNLGFNKDNLIQINLQGSMLQHFEALRQEFINTGLVENAALADHPTLYGGNNTGGMTWAGEAPGANVVISQRVVSEEYLRTLGMKLIEGRDFESTDGINIKTFKDSVNRVLVTASMEKLMGNGSAIGKILTHNSNMGPLRLQIVGVVKDYVYGDMYGHADPVVFYDFPGETSLMYVRLKVGASPESALLKMEGILKKDNPGYPFAYVFVDDQFNNLFASENLISKLSSVFAFLAILISCLGLFGLAAYTAERRIKEIGIRKVLGASAGNITRLLSQDFLQLVLLSCLVAFPLAGWMMSHWLQGYAYRIGISVWVFVLAGAASVLIALATVSFQAIRAALANPVKSLRAE